MIYDLRLTIGETVRAIRSRHKWREDAAERSFSSSRGNEAPIFPVGFSADSSLTPSFRLVISARTKRKPSERFPIHFQRETASVCSRNLQVAPSRITRGHERYLKVTVTTGRICEISKPAAWASTRRLGRGSTPSLHAQRTDQIHVEDLNARVRQRDDDSGFVHREQNLLGMVNVNGAAIQMDGEPPKRCVLQRCLKVALFHVGILTNRETKATVWKLIEWWDYRRTA